MMETFEQKLVNELKIFQKAFKSTIDYQKYEINVFECLNKRYIEAGHLIDEYERRQKFQSENSKLSIPLINDSLSNDIIEFIEWAICNFIFVENTKLWFKDGYRERTTKQLYDYYLKSKGWNKSNY